MNLLKAAGWCADYILKSCMPLQRVPSLWDLEAEALAEQEARDKMADYWASKPRLEELGYEWPEKKPDPVVEAVELLRDIRNILQSSVALVSPEAATERPAACEPSAAPAAGPPNLTCEELESAANAIRCYGVSRVAPEFWYAIADKLDPSK